MGGAKLASCPGRHLNLVTPLHIMTENLNPRGRLEIATANERDWQRYVATFV